jgi:hypothetical protein
MPATYKPGSPGEAAMKKLAEIKKNVAKVNADAILG